MKALALGVFLKHYVIPFPAAPCRPAQIAPPGIHRTRDVNTPSRYAGSVRFNPALFHFETVELRSADFDDHMNRRQETQEDLEIRLLAFERKASIVANL